MKNKLKKLKTRKYAATIIIGLLLVFIVGLISLLKPVVKNIKIDKVLTKTTSLNASVLDGVSEGVTSNNYDEIKYQIKVNKDKTDQAVITASLTDNENKYARFKEIKGAEITNDGKNIKITTTKSRVTITVVVENAPYGTIINPKININSLNEENSKINVEPVTITGKSVEGKVVDEKGTLYSGIELGLTKNEEEVKRTYTKSDGEYVFSLGDVDTYEIKLEEEKYKIVRFEEETSDENRRIINIVIKEIEPFSLNIKKTISKLELIINGEKKTYNYKNESTVVESLKNAKTIEGSVYYNISIKNEGEVKGTLTVLKDILPEGLSFDEKKNPGWTQDSNNLFYTVIEGKEIDAFDKVNATLVLDIVKTNEAKNYINKAITNGEDYKYVAYYLNNKVYKEEYVASSEKIKDINPGIENFDGWYTDREYTNKYNFKNTVTKDIILFGKIKDNKYNVTFVDKNPNNGEETIIDIKEVEEGGSLDLVDALEYRGYTFECFELNDKCYDDEEIIEDVTLYTKYTINKYDITYDLDGGSLEEDNPDEYTVNDEFTLNKPTKEGFTFIGWIGTDLSEETLDLTISKGSIGDREYTACYEINKSTLTINPNGGTYLDNASSVSYKENYGTVKHISESVRRGYNFKRYDKTGGGSFLNNTFTFDNDDAELTAVYEIINYKISYSNVTPAEITYLNNPISYNVETESFELRNPNTRKDEHNNNSEDFIGWDDGNGNVSNKVIIEKNSIGEKNYTAVWRENQDDYSITYDLHGGEYESGKTNPNTYKRSTETFTLNNPSKLGYNFAGWTGTGLNSATSTVTIPKGSAGVRSYEANYSIVNYKITYVMNGGTVSTPNLTGYNVETNTFTLTNPTKTGYTFKGWSGTDIEDKSLSVIISKGSVGDRTYTANFEKAEYTISCTLNGGEYESGKTNPTKYSIESDPITLNNPSKVGYDFVGWSGTGIDGIVSTVTIPTGSIGHRSYLANYTPIVYSITYDYDGGSLEEGKTNPSTYTIESEDIILNTPIKEGYIFKNYTMDNSIISSIPTGSYGNKTLKATYEIRKYDINYYNESAIHSNEKIDWNTKANKPSADPTKPHHVFLYWSENGVDEYDFDTLIHEDKNLYAVYEEVISPEIAIDPSLDEETNKTWVCGDSSNEECGVTVTITTDHDEYELYYKIGDGEAHLYIEPFKVYENETIYAWSRKSNINSVITEEEIVNVDSIAPTINNPGTGAMSFNMSVSGTAQDAGSGVKKFTLYAKEKTELTFNPIYTYSTNDFDGIKDHAENYDHTFYNVKDNTEYIVKIVAEDYVGNKSEREVEVVTHPYVARVVGKNGILWYTVDPDTKELIPDDGKEFLMFDSIQSAVDYCENIDCTIQTNPILPVVNESVTIGVNQNITIDLDGRTITSNQNATFTNNGILQVVDRNPRLVNDEHDSIGKVTNTEGKAIINNGSFILGDGSSEASPTFIYPEFDRPIIEGKQAAIEQNNKFYFYDGKIVSDTLALIDNGDDPITQYSYNIAITTENDKNVGTLRIVSDPEARIRSTYYTKLKIDNGDNAFDFSKTGTISTESAKILSKIKQYGDYGFTYDAVNDLIYNGNQSSSGTTAISYLKLDLTKEETNGFFLLDLFADTHPNSSGYVAISETLGDVSNKIITMSGNDVIKNRLYELEKGKVYYIHFGFVKASETDAYEIFKITNLKLLGERELTTDYELLDDNNYYKFVRQEDGSYKSSNYHISSSYSHSYMIYDLSKEEEDINLAVNVSISSQANNDIGYAYLSNNEAFQPHNNTNNRFIYTSGSYENQTYTTTLQAGKINYVHFGYYKNGGTNTGDDTFTINSLALYKTKSESITLNSEISHNENDTYFFEERNYNPLVTTFTDLSGNGNDGIGNSIVYDDTNSRIIFDGSNSYISYPEMNLNEFTWETTFSVNTIKDSTMMANYQTGGIGIYIRNGEICTEAYLDGSYKELILSDSIEIGAIYKVTITYDGEVFAGYLNDTFIDSTTGTTLKDPENNTVLMLGTDPSGVSPTAAKCFDGAIYNAKVYNRSLTLDEIGTNPTNGLILHMNADSLVQRKGYISNNTRVKNVTAHSYLTYDLTNVNEDKFLYINTFIRSQSGKDIGYIQVTDSPAKPTTTADRILTVSGSVDNQSAIVRLTKNRVNYVHFMYVKNNDNTHTGEDAFYIDDIRYFNTIEDAYSVNKNSHVKVNNYYFEKPILNEDVETIEILKNITLDSSIVVPQEKAVILDLNGFTLTSNKNDYVIKNNGNLTIIDSDYEDRKNQNINYKLIQSRLFEDAKARYLEDLEKYREYAGLCEDCEPSEQYELDKQIITDFSYKGNYEEYIAPYTGDYKIQTWGASGGRSICNDSVCGTPGKGGYSEGIIHLNQGDKIYVYVGQKGTDAVVGTDASASFNGGGSGTWDHEDNESSGAGGGATDIRITPGDWNDSSSLASRIMVAGGGGGSAYEYTAGYGGGLSGGDNSLGGALGATQTTGYAFGIGKNAEGTGDNDGVAGGGGGYYGGLSYDSKAGETGSGGSGYVSGHTGAVAIKAEDDTSPLDGCDDGTTDIECSYHYSGNIFAETVMKSGNEEMPTYVNKSTMTGNTGNGYAKITYLITDEEYNEIIDTFENQYTVTEEPVFKDYLTNIDFDSNTNIDELNIDSNPEYNSITTEEVYGSITSTIENVLLNEEHATLTLSSGNINVNANDKKGIVNRGALYVKDGIINANNSSTIGIVNETNGDIVEFKGIINANGSSSCGLQNLSNDPAINNLRITTGSSNAIGIRNNSLKDVTFNNLNIDGTGLGFRERSVANTVISDSTIKSTSNSSLYSESDTMPSKLIVNSSSLIGSVQVKASPKAVTINNSTFSSVYNTFGNLIINNSTLSYIENNGTTVVNNSTINSSGQMAFCDLTYTPVGSKGTIDYLSKLTINGSILNSTATSATTLINNKFYLIIKDTTINNINGAKSTVISNDTNTYIDGYLNISGNTYIDPSFKTAVSNKGVFTLGTLDKNVANTYEYGYTGHQEVFTAPETGTYKLETWGAAGGESKVYRGSGFYGTGRGAKGAYASGTIELQEGDKLYIHVGGQGTGGYTSETISNYYGTYNGGGALSGSGTSIVGSGGGATDISLSSEDNEWIYESGVTSSRRSAASYEQRILVAGGGGNYYGSAGGTDNTSTLGYGARGAGGGYYGGTSNNGGSSYADSSLTDVVLKNGEEEMPDYSSSGLLKGNIGSGYAKITLLSSEEKEKVTATPMISAANAVIEGNGRFYYYDGTIEGSEAIATDIEGVPEGFDIYKTTGNTEKIILVNNDDSRPVNQGEESYVAAIGDAKFTTIQNAIDASNNGDEIDLLVDIYQQNTINIAQDKEITIDYNGHFVTSYSSEKLYNNSGILTIKDSVNTKTKNLFSGGDYIYNTGTLTVSNIYIDNSRYSNNIINNVDGVVSINDVKFDLGHNSISNKYGVLNSENGVVSITNSTLNLLGNNNMVENHGTLTMTGNTITSNDGDTIVHNLETGTAMLDNNNYSVSGNDSYGRYFLYNRLGNATIRNMTTLVEDIYNSGVLTFETNNIPSGNINGVDEGLIVINSGTYGCAFNINGTGRTIDNTENLYSFVMNDGTINKILTISSSGISSIKGGTISVTSGVAINNSGPGIINLGIKDGSVLPKENTKPIITGATYGIYTSNPALIVNFYDGIIKGQKAYNATVEDIEIGYSIHLDYDSTNDIETKYLTSETMFINTTNNTEYNSVNDLNTAIANGLISNTDVIKVTRNITLTKTTSPITIPVGVKLIFDINGKIIDKNNNIMFIINGELDIDDSVNNSNGKIDSTIGDIFVNNRKLNIFGGKYISEKDVEESEIVKNNENAILDISDGDFTKYYDAIESRFYQSGSIINNSGTALVSNGNFTTNGSHVIGSARIYVSSAFTNNETGTLTVTGGNYDGITSVTWDGYNGVWKTSATTRTGAATTNKGALIYNKGIATISDITSEETFIGENNGTLTFDNVTMLNIAQINENSSSSTRGSYPPFVNTGDLIIDDSTFGLYAPFVENNGGNITIDNTTIDRKGNGLGALTSDSSVNLAKNTHVIRNKYNSTLDNKISINNSFLYHKGGYEVFDNAGRIDLYNTTVSATSNSAIVSTGLVNIDKSIIRGTTNTIKSTSSTLNIKGNTKVEATAGQAILLSNSTLNLGESIEEDEAVSTTYPEIKGTTYAINNSGTINFYDGILKGKTNQVNGTVNNTEPGYATVLGADGDYKTMYLDKVQIIKNVTKSTSTLEVKYYDLKTAFDEASSGDTLQMIADYNNLPIDETAVVDVNVTLDLNGKVIKQANDKLFEVNSTLTLVDSSEGNIGNIIAIGGNEAFDNNGTINLIDATVSTTAGKLIFKNNSGATLIIKDEGKVNSNSGSTLIDNSGTVNIYNGAYLHNKNGRMIINGNILNIIDLNNDDDPNTSSELTAPWIYDEGSGSGDIDDAYTNSAIRTLSGATTTMYGGIYNNGKTYETGSPDSANIIENSGTTIIKNLHSYAYKLGYNNGTLNIDNSHFYNAASGLLHSRYGTLNMSNTTIEVTNTSDPRIYFGTSTLDHITIVGQNPEASYKAHLANIYGPTTISHSTINYQNYNGIAIWNNSTLDITDTTINLNIPFSNTATMTLDSTTITSTGVSISNSNKLTLKNNTHITSSGDNAINNGGTLNVEKTTSVISGSSNAINLSGGTLNLGEMGGTPDIETPYIEGYTYGVYRSSQSAKFNFYDGLIVGKTGPNAVYGGVTDVESGYETEHIIETNPENENDKTYKEYLIVSATSVAVAKVGNYSFTSVGTITPSKALQNAINFAIGDGSNVKPVDLIANIDLVNDEEIITASMPVTINLGNFTINQNSNYYLDSNITANNNLGASVSKLLADVFDISYSPKDIIIYELSDGSSLDTSKVYRLYKDGKLVKLEKEELGKYKYNGNTESLTPIKGRLYIDNLYKGSYRLESSDNKYIEFSIDEDGNISGNVTQNTKNSNSTEAISKSEAELILNIQTGNKKHYYLFLLIPIFIISILLIRFSIKNIKREI